MSTFVIDPLDLIRGLRDLYATAYDDRLDGMVLSVQHETITTEIRQIEHAEIVFSSPDAGLSIHLYATDFLGIELRGKPLLQTMLGCTIYLPERPTTEGITESQVVDRLIDWLIALDQQTARQLTGCLDYYLDQTAPPAGDSVEGVMASYKMITSAAVLQRIRAKRGF